jgi:hypothetical protein
MNLTYQTTDPQQPPTVDVSLDAANTIRFTVGTGLDFQVFQLYADASFGAVTTITVGISFSN